MTLFLQVCGGVVLAVILVLTLKSHCSEIATVLAIFVCCMAALAAISYLKPVLTFLQVLEQLGNLDNSMVKTLLKVTGIGLLTEVSRLICKAVFCPINVTWVVRSQAELDACRGDFEIFIFESFIPKD